MKREELKAGVRYKIVSENWLNRYCTYSRDCRQWFYNSYINGKDEKTGFDVSLANISCGKLSDECIELGTNWYSITMHGCSLPYWALDKEMTEQEWNQEQEEIKIALSKLTDREKELLEIY